MPRSAGNPARIDDRNHDHRITDDRGKVTGYRDLNSIGQLLSNTMIRRRKKGRSVAAPRAHGQSSLCTHDR
ncbi:MAG: hypothetical protein HC905_07605 [Bacteroidales bacterium]|nr:hypothetical protein [Bacteroidales bacterium]